MAIFIEINSHITGYHVYKNMWVPVLGETLRAMMEPNNIEDDYAVCVKKNELVVGHLERGHSGRFAQTIFFFLRADSTARCDAIITGPPINLGDMLGQKVPCLLRITGKKEYVRVLETTINQL